MTEPMTTFWHGTMASNASRIKRSGLRPGLDGAVWVSDEPEYARYYAEFRAIEAAMRGSTHRHAATSTAARIAAALRPA